MEHLLRTSLLTALMSIASVGTFASDFVVGGICYDVISLPDMTCEVSGWESGLPEEVVISDEVQYQGKVLKVVAIKRFAFWECQTIKSVSISNGIKSIGEGAFSGCSVKKVILPEHLEGIERNTFRETSLETITLPDGLTYIKDDAFYLSDLTSINIPNSVTQIGSWAFKGCPLSSISLPKSLESIGSKAFADCHIVQEVLRIPASCRSIGENAFESCQFQKLIFEDSEEVLRLWYVREGFESLYGSKSVGKGAFSDMQINDLYLGREISCATTDDKRPLYYQDGEHTFGEQLQSVTFAIPSAKNISDHSFYSLQYVSDVTFTERVEYVDGGWFSNADNITVLNETPPLGGNFSNSQYLNARLRVPKGSISKYQEADGWKNFWNIEEVDFVALGIKPAQTADASEMLRYSLSGQRLSSPKRGINIVRMSDGTVRKVMVK